MASNGVRLRRNASYSQLNDFVHHGIVPLPGTLDGATCLHDLADSILEECKKAAPLSELETAIWLLREALSRRPVPHHRRSDSLNDLAMALLTRYWKSGYTNDLEEALSMWMERFQLSQMLEPEIGTRDTSQFSGNTVAELDETTKGQDQEAYEMTDRAIAILTRINQSAELSSLDRSVSLHRAALLLRPTPHPHRANSLSKAAIALCARFFHTQVLEDLDLAIFIHLEVQHLGPSILPSHFDFLVHRSAALLMRFGKTANLIDLRDAAQYLFDADALQKEARQLYKVATDILEEFDRSGRLSDLNTAILHFREALELFPAPHPDQWSSLNNLSSALSKKFDRTGQLTDLDEATRLHQDALKLFPVPHPNRWTSLNNLALVLKTRFGQTTRLADLDKAIQLHREALRLLHASHPNRSNSLCNLADTLYTRFCQTGQLADLDEAIKLHQEVLRLIPASHPDRFRSLNNLASILTARFDQTGQLADLEEAIGLHREALGLLPASHLHRPTSLNNLALPLNTRFDRAGRLADLNEAMKLLREALELLPAPHPNRSSTLNNLANALYAQFGQTGHLADLNEVIKFHREALALSPAPRPDRSGSLNNLANALYTLFDQTNQLADLDEAIKLHREALSLRPASHPDRSSSLNNLATTLTVRFRHTGQLADLNKAIGLLREALELRPVPHPNRSSSLNNLANNLDIRFGQTRQLADLDEAMKLLREALGLLLVSHPNRSTSLNNLANNLDLRSDHTNQLTDIDEAIQLHREALGLRPVPHPDRVSSTHNLALALNTRFGRTSQLIDLNEANELLHQALALKHVPHPGRAGLLNLLASTLYKRSQYLDHLPDLKEAILISRQALHVLARGHPDTCLFSRNLGRALFAMYSQTQQLEHLDDGMSKFQAAVKCESASTLERFRASRLWAHCADTTHESALEAYRSAIDLLPRLAMLGLNLQSRQEALSGSDGIARNAAACAIRSNQFSTAVELLEEGRAIFWSQALQLRTPLDDLKSVASDLARKLEGIARALEQGSRRDISRSAFDSTQKVMSMEQEAAHYHQLNEDWVSTLEEARKLDGFQDFLRPKSCSTLQRSASNGPVIILNASKSGCAALILTSSGVEHVSLPEFTLQTAESLVERIHTIPSASSRGERKWGRVPSPTSDEIFRSALARLWRSVVEPVIRCLNLQKSKSPPRLWWCPTGPFAFLPIHAAGIYNGTKGESECVFDYVVSSYTPTVSALLAPPHPPADPFKMMVVIQPDIPGYPTLPKTREELSKIEAYVPSQYLTRLGIPEAPASVERVFSGMSCASIVHFACHGVQDAKNPLESAVILEDGRLKVSRIMAQLMPNASLAFLSACQTATGDAKLPDEVIHLAATLVFAGFRSTVATMWSIRDVDGPKVADRFYAHLFQDRASPASSRISPDTTEAARALHLAVAKLRAENCSFVRWVPFIHLGL